MGAQLTRLPEDDSGFLERWSRRKRTSERELDAQPTVGEPILPEVSEEEISPEELAALPAPEDITIDTDITPFLKRGVPRALKNAALRSSWLTNPAIRDHKDLAVDYAWDWNVPGGVPGFDGPLSSKSVADLLQKMGRGDPEVAGKHEQSETTTPEAPQNTTEAAVPPPAERGEAHDAQPEAGIAEPAPKMGERHVADLPQQDTPKRHGGARPV